MRMDPPLHFSHSSGKGAAGLSAAQFSTGRGGDPGGIMSFILMHFGYHWS